MLPSHTSKEPAGEANSAQTESVCAGALHIQLAGDAYYFGELYHKDTIGDNDRPVKHTDIRRTNRLMYLTAVLCWLIGMGFRILLYRGVM